MLEFIAGHFVGSGSTQSLYTFSSTDIICNTSLICPYGGGDDGDGVEVGIEALSGFW